MKNYTGLPSRLREKKKRATAATHIRREISARSAAERDEMLRQANKIYDDTLVAIDALAAATGFRRGEIAQVAFGFKKPTLPRAPSLFNACVSKLMRVENDRKSVQAIISLCSNLAFQVFYPGKRNLQCRNL